MEITATALKIPFKITFKHARIERRQTQSIFVTIKKNSHTGLGEACPREYVTGETVASCLQWIEDNKKAIVKECTNVQTLKNWGNTHRADIDQNPSAWCAVELALLDLFAKEENKTVEQLLLLASSAGTYHYSAVIGDGNNQAFYQMLAKYKQFGFWDYKLKVSGDSKSDNLRMKQIKESGKKVRIRLDANNFWGNDIDEAANYLKAIEYPLLAVEEPLDVINFDGVKQLSDRLNLPVVFDESVCNIRDLNRVNLPPQNCLLNVRISKMGGLLRSLEIIDQIQQRGFRIIVGCLVGETSLLSRVALIAAKYSGNYLEAQEGAFGDLLLEYDHVEPMIRFGEKGLFEFKEVEQANLNKNAGWGLQLSSGF